MSNYERFWAFLLFPIMLAYSIFEIRRGWRVLHGAGYLPSIRNKCQQRLIKLSKGKQYEDEFIKSMTNNPQMLKKEAYTSLLGGIIYIILFSWLLIMALIT